LTRILHFDRISEKKERCFDMKAVIDADMCIGCGLCAQVAPEVYEMQDDKAIVIGDDIPEDKVEDAKSGADQCPVTAIVIS
jgi:ferredoxin